jgi:hypothetical protein
MDGATSPLLHLFSFTSQNLVLAVVTHSNWCCTTESRSFWPQCHRIVIRQHTPISSLSLSLARLHVLRSISCAYDRDVCQCTHTYENVDVEDTTYKCLIMTIYVRIYTKIELWVTACGWMDGLID